MVRIGVLPHPFHPAQEPAHDGLEARLLGHLAYDGLVERLTGLHTATGHRPLAGGGAPSPAHEEDPVVVHHDRAHRDRWAGVTARPRSALPQSLCLGGARRSAWSVRCITSARAVKPLVSKKFLAARCPGRATASTPTQPRAAQNSISRSTISSPMPTLPRVRLDEQVGDDAEPVTGPQRLDGHHAEPEDDVVEAADGEQGVGLVEQRAVRGVERLRPRLALVPELSAAHRAELTTQRSRQFDDVRKVGRGRGPGALHRRQRVSE